MATLATAEQENSTIVTSTTRVEAHLLQQNTQDFVPYYNGKMSYKLAGQDWEKYVTEAFPSLRDTQTSENVFKGVIDLYAESLVPQIKELRGFSNSLVPLLSTGRAVVIRTKDGKTHFPEHFEVISDGNFSIAAIMTRNLSSMKDLVTFVASNGTARVFSKDIPEDFGAADYTQGFTFVSEEQGATLYRFALDDKGFGGVMMALQDRVNHSILDQTVVAEMYARPFWYLLNADVVQENPYLPKSAQPDGDNLKEQKTRGAAGRVFTSSAEGPFGQLEPPTLSDMVSYHDSMLDKVSQNSGIPQFYFKPGSGTPPTGVALKVLSKRFNTKVSRMRDDIFDEMERLATDMGLAKNGKDEDDKPIYEFWSASDDLLQEALDAHGIALTTMGYPLEYVASVVTPGVDLDDYEEEEGLPADGVPVPPGTDMTATGQTGLPATPGQVAAYEQNPGQRAKAKA